MTEPRSVEELAAEGTRWTLRELVAKATSLTPRGLERLRELRGPDVPVGDAAEAGMVPADGDR